MIDFESSVFLEEMKMLYCKNCNDSFRYNLFKNGCCPNCGKAHPDFNPKRKFCFECGSENKMRDRYCRYCGKTLGKEFQPYLNLNDCIYGPPPFKSDFACESCGHKWSGFEDEHYCPKCGSKELQTNLIYDRDDEWYEFWNLDKETFIKQKQRSN